MIKNKIVRFIATGLAMLLLSGIFYELGVWQWHRAQATAKQAKIMPSSTPIALTAIDGAGKNMRTKAINRIVTFEGRFVRTYVAPTQNIAGLGYRDLLVELCEISGNRAILVVRGLNDGSIKPTSQRLLLTGRLYPSQREDHGFNSEKSLGRLDPALVAGTGGYSLFDGYVIVQKEVTATGAEIAGHRVPSPVLKQSVAGFYWQHIAYVVIWWFMALLVLAAPIISRRYAKVSAIEDKVAL
jgi:cytochrome oxidase assembly protein ShyY1